MCTGSPPEGEAEQRISHYLKKAALAGNRTRVNCLEGSYANHYTTNACSQTLLWASGEYLLAG